MSYGQQKPKTLFGKLVDNINSCQITNHYKLLDSQSKILNQSEVGCLSHQNVNQKFDGKNGQVQIGKMRSARNRQEEELQNKYEGDWSQNMMCGFGMGTSCGMIGPTILNKINHNHRCSLHEIKHNASCDAPISLEDDIKLKNSKLMDKQIIVSSKSDIQPYEPSFQNNLEKNEQNKNQTKQKIGIKQLVTQVEMDQFYDYKDLSKDIILPTENKNRNQDESDKLESDYLYKIDLKQNNSQQLASIESSCVSPYTSQNSPTINDEQVRQQSSGIKKARDDQENIIIQSQNNTVTNFNQNDQTYQQQFSIEEQRTEESRQTQSSDIHKMHLIQTLQSLQYMKIVQQPTFSQILQRSVNLPKTMHKKVLIFDLDETLVHCVDDIANQPYDLPISVNFQTGETVDAGINIRPFAYECLKQAQKNYQVVVFTASHQAYADVVLNTLESEFKKSSYLTDEEKFEIQKVVTSNEQQHIMKSIKENQKLFDFRLYRDHCIKTPQGIYIKDLRILKNQDLSQVIIVDNAVYSFGYQLNNGIPIIPFYDVHTTNIQDEELVHLSYYINCIVNSEDVRVQNKQAFQLEELQQTDITEQIKLIQQQNSQLQNPQSASTSQGVIIQGDTDSFQNTTDPENNYNQKSKQYYTQQNIKNRNLVYCGATSTIEEQEDEEDD